MDRTRSILTIAFFVGIGFWHAAERYIGIRFGLSFPLDVDPPTWIDAALQLVTILALVNVLLAVAFRSYQRRTVEWRTPALFLLIVGSVLASWRFGISPHFLPTVPGDKLIAGLIMQILPIVAAIGVAAAYMEWKHALSSTSGPAGSRPSQGE